MAELKPCPFCGGKARIEQTSYGTIEQASVKLGFTLRCTKCNATTSLSSGYIAANLSQDGDINIWHDDREKVVLAWNRRADNG